MFLLRTDNSSVCVFLVAAHYGHNRERNRIVRGDVSQARTEQEDELKQALALQQFQQELRLQQ